MRQLQYLEREYGDQAPMIFARDASDIASLYEQWGWTRLHEEGCSHIVVWPFGYS